MSRWLLLSLSVLILGTVTHLRSVRSPSAQPLGGACVTDRDCQIDLECVSEPDVIEGQCSATCNSSESCTDQFGAAMCLGADLCARACDANNACPDGIVCNAYGWCER